MKAPKSFRLHIGIFGKRNVGKSSVLNALTQQEVSIVSEVAGTTTDPVEKPMELLPLGPVLFIDTAGIDDVGALGEKRIRKTMAVFDRTDLGIIVSNYNDWDDFEEKILQELNDRNIPAIIVFNKTDIYPSGTCLQNSFSGEKIPFVETSAVNGEGILALRQTILKTAPDDFINRPSILADLVGPGEAAILVVPIDKEAPKGRLILPQVQSIRDLLDGDAFCMVTKERELRDAFSRLNKPPKLVVTDSQAFLKVAADTPPEIPLTSFSILFARYQGDLEEMVRGAMAIDQLKTGDKVLIAEACSHHPIGEDIGTVKIPRWLTQYVGGKLQIDNLRGHDFPDNISEYKLIIHCGACMWNRREMLSRIMKARQAGVPITNYGLTIAYSLGIFERALQPFPAALEIFRKNR
ncbi:MAG: [FeFe] hydrogenase H-cluster maturation GTPase HydF [Bacteroidetes bacterium GWF2_42_66]|nr:MAG: [FeFe] hydrogenase H-cluster maturation GTPase HydF [Bacteroidetes bacterium GWA2_42_15]OFY00142.1 MAG: [FeFe] hydrogenase H-cluster maturation GTPase HydF [Bacteroidetes bacterium GWE2_42_39]OFY40284.1 MAG: [FeFe] hydrogenase H-cluster maturation GTPase HydF [Bacteroidetes bacterium GWF2_42_66]HBL73735.1 [FeFe] hydrogenase H-cluster maturation GTPase HydF [Prolixibacteraceae bacterium]HCR91198.1 [FeFe] hydrogenase H-cluster maturation GTPase HydF [Prolixibacteraceae bacterium]